MYVDEMFHVVQMQVNWYFFITSLGNNYFYNCGKVTVVEAFAFLASEFKPNKNVVHHFEKDLRSLKTSCGVQLESSYSATHSGPSCF